MSRESDSSDPKPYSERLDPGRELHGQLESLERLASFWPVRLLMKRAGTADEVARKLEEMRASYGMVDEAEAIAEALAPLGWPMFELAPVDEYRAAAALVRSGRSDEAEALLTQTWNEDDCLQLRFVNRVFSLYSGDEERQQIALERQRHLTEALDLHREERYAAAISMTLAQIDGIFMDMIGANAGDFFNPKNPHLVDDLTLGGHPLGLKALSQLLGKGVKNTTTGDDLKRHGILHGRVLGYDTLRNSTKTLVAAITVIEAVRPKANALNAQAAAQREAKYAGSKEVDEWGMRLDRRGFEEAKMTLWDLHTAQFFAYAADGRYTADRRKLNRAHSPVARRDFNLELADDGQQFWAWVATPTGVVFGMAVRGGAQDIWVYFAEEPPTGGIGSSPAWRSFRDEESYPDW